MGRVYEMAAHLLLAETPFSRNRNFEAFDDPRYARAIGLYRRLRALLSDLERAMKDGTRLFIAEETRAGRTSVRLELTSERYRRTCFVEQPAWEVLMRHPRAREAVAALANRSIVGSDVNGAK